MPAPITAMRIVRRQPPSARCFRWPDRPRKRYSWVHPQWITPSLTRRDRGVPCCVDVESGGRRPQPRVADPDDPRRAEQEGLEAAPEQQLERRREHVEAARLCAVSPP